MEIRICKDRYELGKSAAKHVAQVLREVIAEKGTARIVLSTGASQFDTIEALTKEPGIKWDCVEMFHLDEYVNLPVTHPASFRKYLQERFVDKVAPLKAVHFVDGTKECIEGLTKELRSAPIDIGLSGIGENGHIAFNDPPADFDTKEAYIIVNLDEKCKKQQMGEGWFATMDDVPKQALTMGMGPIFKARKIILLANGANKAEAIKQTLAGKVSTLCPSTLLMLHPDVTVICDEEAYSLVK